MPSADAGVAAATDVREEAMKLTLPEARMLLSLADEGATARGDNPMSQREEQRMNRVLTKVRREVRELEANDKLTEAEVRLRSALHMLWLSAGEPSVRQMARQIEPAKSHMTWHYALKCEPVPPLSTLRALVNYLDGDVAAFERLWFEAKGIERTM